MCISFMKIEGYIYILQNHLFIRRGENLHLYLFIFLSLGVKKKLTDCYTFTIRHALIFMNIFNIELKDIFIWFSWWEIDFLPNLTVKNCYYIENIDTILEKCKYFLLEQYLVQILVLYYFDTRKSSEPIASHQ